ncbi:MAG: response regulator transcription factor [Rhodanobacter sp.]|nr:MAG: response regulator transcription factor [Rhodanobacter sp.]TAM01316.1 MAG: response regulator transcription factor [Rhodanobacter sp.]TAM39505.1 MAG: response regulator transcription factor [Rhodanobacter sp.]TAN29076.1 MAG: response regulator transcription factor [Rhodanobacter sp.]
MSGEPRTLILVDDHPLVRDGLRVHLEAVPGLHVVGECGSGREALNLAATLRPDIALVDISMPDIDGLELVSRLRRLEPAPECIILSMFDKPEYVRQSVRAGSRGYVLKDSPAGDILTAIEAVASGGNYYSAALVQGLASLAQPAPGLTKREREILILVAGGASNKRIAQICGISCRTVETHRLSTRRKLGIESTAGLVRYAMEQSWIV